ncbi:helix-turn-helix domain-containing protein [Microscilla marina]|uniref:Transcriptional regulator, putative n=1 Tax=Microscilla marina ATCC 23134 TaxID=313606 RepID=A1ZDW2_MICM2|nr:helix-turn-helix domain-containing protein [Microscilla marina]EAY31270.1 transcriptional regulator, putative [Microscilla marina ATCC 23134]
MIAPHLDVFAVLIFLGVIQALFLALQCLFGQPRLEPSNRFLAFNLLANAATLLEIFLCYSGYIIYTLHYYDVSEPFNFVYAPLLWLYLRTYLNQSTPQKWYLHFIPFLFYTLYCALFFIQSAAYKYNAFLYAYHPELPYIHSTTIWTTDPLGIKAHINTVSILFNGVYYYLIIRFIIQYTKQHQLSFFKSLPNKRLRWVRTFFILSAFSYIHWVYRTFFVLRDLQDYTSAALSAVIIYYMSFMLMQHPEVFRRRKQNNAPKYAKSGLSESEKEVILAQLTQLMQNEKLYLDNLISLPQLAKKLAVPSHSISQVLNEQLQKNFFGFLADYRVQEAKELLSNPAFNHLTIEEIATRVGYNSKSAFNNVFKKITHTTPSAYRKKHT